MKTKKEFPIGTLILFLSAVILLVVAYITLLPQKKVIPQELIAALRPHAVPIQPFVLTDQNGKLYTEQKLKGKWSFVFFGYTYCPDVCPTTLSTLRIVSDEIKKSADAVSDIQILFISVDPDRDSPEVLARYMEYFGPEFTGVTGFPDELTRLSKQFGAAYIVEPETEPGSYLVSHTSSVFLVGPQARIIAAFSPPHKPEIITSLYLQIRELFK